MIEASPDMQKGDSSEKEWYYSHPKDKEKMGPYSFQEASDSMLYTRVKVLPKHPTEMHWYCCNNNVPLLNAAKSPIFWAVVKFKVFKVVNLSSH